MRSPDQLAALSVDELHRLILRQSGYIDHLEQRIDAVRKALGIDSEAAAALRAQIGQEEGEKRERPHTVIVQALYPALKGGIAANRAHRILQDLHEAGWLRDLGYGPEGEAR